MSGVSEPLVSLRGVGFTYRGATRPALRGVDLDIQPGEMVVVMGASGAGKSTLGKCIQRSVPAYQPGELVGEIHIAGVERSGQGVDDLAGIVALVTQDFEAQLFSTNVVTEVAFGLEQMGIPETAMERRLQEALELVGLGGFERRDPTTLSGGEKQRLSIAAVLALRPQLLIFDEPTTDLDPLGKREIFAVLATLRDRGASILLIEHEIAAARDADRMLLLEAGEIVEDAPPDALLGRVERLRELGVRAADLDRVAAGMGRERRFASFEEAVEQLVPRRQGGVPPAVEAAAAPAPPVAPLLELRGVSYAYPDGPEVLRRVDLRVSAGEIVALVGPNGCGKTTLSKQLNGLLRPSRGQVLWRGCDVREQPLAELARRVAYVFQDPDQQIFAASVREEVRFALDNQGVAEAEIEGRVGRVLARFELAEHAAEDPFLLGKGMRQRLAVASLLVMEPQLLILDEPTTGLDDREQRQLLELLVALAAEGMAVLLITHAPWVVAEYAPRCLAMAQGELVFDGATRAFLADAALARRCDFTAPEVSRLGLALGAGACSVEELLAALGRGGGE